MRRNWAPLAALCRCCLFPCHGAQVCPQPLIEPQSGQKESRFCRSASELPTPTANFSLQTSPRSTLFRTAPRRQRPLPLFKSKLPLLAPVRIDRSMMFRSQQETWPYPPPSLVRSFLQGWKCQHPRQTRPHTPKRQHGMVDGCNIWHCTAMGNQTAALETNNVESGHRPSRPCRTLLHRSKAGCDRGGGVEGSF